MNDTETEFAAGIEVVVEEGVDVELEVLAIDDVVVGTVVGGIVEVDDPAVVVVAMVVDAALEVVVATDVETDVVVSLFFDLTRR